MHPPARPCWLLAAALLVLGCAKPEVAAPTPSAPPAEEIPAERTPLTPQAAPVVCFHESATLLACEAVARPTDVPAALSELRTHLESAARRPPLTEGDPNVMASPAQLDPLAQELDATARSVACHAEPDSAAWALYWMARVRYDVHQFDQAATLFDAVVTRAPSSELSPLSVNLSLDSLLMRGRQVRSVEPSCRERLAARLPVYRASLCETQDPPEDVCATLVRLQCQLGRAEADQVATRMPAQASAEYEALAQQSCQPGDELFYNAALCAERAGDADRAQALREELNRRFPQSSLRNR